MVRRRERQRSLWEVVLPDADKLWPADLRRIDTLLDEADVLDPIVAALEARWAQSRRRGRPGTPAEVVLRMFLLKHLYRWSYDTLEHEVRANLVYRAFARVGAGAVPDAKTILKIARALGPDGDRAGARPHRRVGGRAEGHARTAPARGHHRRRDARPLPDRQHLAARQRAGADPRHAARRRGLGRRGRARAESAAQCRPPGPRDCEDGPPRRRRYRAPPDLPAPHGNHRAVLRDADTMVRRIAHGRTVSPAGQRVLRQARASLEHMRPLARRVLAQTRARVLGGDTHVPDKVLSVFEPHTEAIRKGKLVKPTEFGKLVTIQESEGQIVSAYEVHRKRPADRTLWTRALDVHQQHFGRAPDLATGDRGYSSAANEAAAVARGVRRVVLPKRGRSRRPGGRTKQQRWFRRGMRWRVGSRGTDQCPQTSPRPAAVSLSWRRRHGARRGARRDREQLAQHRRPRRPAGASRRVARGAR